MLSRPQLLPLPTVPQREMFLGDMFMFSVGKGSCNPVKKIGQPSCHYFLLWKIGETLLATAHPLYIHY